MKYAEKLSLASRITEPAIRRAIDAFRVVPGSYGLDAGCGAGQHSLWLVEAAGEGSRVVGLDLSEENLEAARDLASTSPVDGRLEYVRGDIFHLDFADETFDWIWCADCLWPVPEKDPLAALHELRRVLKPGGRIGVVFWSSHQLLAGHPELEARLNLAYTDWNPYLGGVAPQRHFLRARGWLSSCSFEALEPRTFVADVCAPLEPKMREALAFCLDMLWGDLGSRISNRDRDELRRLCDPDSVDFIGDLPDYYAFATYTLFAGERASG